MKISDVLRELADSLEEGSPMAAILIIDDGASIDFRTFNYDDNFKVLGTIEHAKHAMLREMTAQPTDYPTH